MAPDASSVPAQFTEAEAAGPRPPDLRARGVDRVVSQGQGGRDVRWDEGLSVWP